MKARFPKNVQMFLSPHRGVVQDTLEPDRPDRVQFRCRLWDAVYKPECQPNAPRTAFAPGERVMIFGMSRDAVLWVGPYVV